jgi:tRNA(Ile2) C34 agmatinyltransferase TiaS
MSTALLDAPRPLFAGGRRSTLEELLEGRWRKARAEGATDCPVCESPMHLEGEAQARCSGCGTTLA